MSNKPGNNSGIKKLNLNNIETCKIVFNESQKFKYCEKVLLLMFGIFPDGEERSHFFMGKKHQIQKMIKQKKYKK